MRVLVFFGDGSLRGPHADRGSLDAPFASPLAIDIDRDLISSFDRYGLHLFLLPDRHYPPMDGTMEELSG